MILVITIYFLLTVSFVGLILIEVFNGAESLAGGVPTKSCPFQNVMAKHLSISLSKATCKQFSGSRKTQQKQLEGVIKFLIFAQDTWNSMLIREKECC